MKAQSRAAAGEDRRRAGSALRGGFRCGYCRALGVLLLLSLAGCGSNVQRASIVPDGAPKSAAAAPPPSTTTSSSTGRPLDIHPTSKKYIVDTTRSRFEVFGRGTVGGEYRMWFTDWQAHVLIHPAPTIDVTIQMASVELDITAAVGIVRGRLLEADRYPRATLKATITRTDGPADEHLVEGATHLHGVRRNLRFMGKLTEEKDGSYRFKTEFIISRKEFNIRYGPIEPFLKDDVRIVVDAIAVPEESVSRNRNPDEDALRGLRH